jgi:ABC-type transport system involved in multi-copper enzyme maturation permease subunit
VNRTIARALLEDAFQQVLDNRVFRLLLVLVLVFVSIFFVIGIHEDRVEVLFGVSTLAYADVFEFFGKNPRAVADAQGTVIQVVEALLIDFLAGDIAMVFCIAATAFFVPRMLEKGSADVLFSKPVSRMTLLFSRWVSGVLFVAILASLLLGGIWLGLLSVSRYNDPGILWAIATLIYLYGIVHAFSLLIGVLTRSTVAAILLSLMLFMGSGCVHTAWRALEFHRESRLAQLVSASADADDERPPP